MDRGDRCEDSVPSAVRPGDTLGGAAHLRPGALVKKDGGVTGWYFGRLARRCSSRTVATNQNSVMAG